MNNAMKLYGIRKFNRKSYFKRIGAGKYQTQGGIYQYNEKRKGIVNQGHAIPEINEIHKNANMSREEKIALAKKILNGIKESKANSVKSKVCIIANRLIKQGATRSTAFKKAWETVKAETIETRVVGVSFGKRQTALENLKKYDYKTSIGT
jgi:hypothetical protein